MTRPYPQVHPHVLVRGDAAAGGGGSSAGVALPFQGARYTLGSTQIIAQATTTTVVWAASEKNYDIGDWFDDANDQFVVPAGVTKVRIKWNMVFGSNVNNNRWGWVEKNGNTFRYAYSHSHAAGAAKAMQGDTGVIEVVQGDTFLIKAHQDSGTGLDIYSATEPTVFAIEAIEATAPSTTRRGCLVHKAVDETGANYSAGVYIPWTSHADGYDTDGIHDVGVENTKLIVPIGVSQIRLSCAVNMSIVTSANDIRILMRKNGAWVTGLPLLTTDVTVTTPWASMSSAVIDVVAGDYFQLWLDTESDTSITVESASWFSMEIVQPAVVSGRPLLLHVRHEETANTHAGAFNSGAWRVRVLNTVPTNEISGASVASNQITLAAGTYEIDGDAPAYKVVSHKARLYDTTGAAVLIVGTSETTNTGTDGESQTRSRIRGRFTLTTESVLELQHRCATTFATMGLGRGVNIDSMIEVYSELMITKIS